MNTHDTYARIANQLGGIPAHLEAGVKDILTQHAAHHNKAGADAEKAASAHLIAPPTAEEIAAVRAKRATKRK